MDLTQRSVLVTGGASGLGLAVAAAMADAGASVTLFDLPSSDGAREARRLGPHHSFVAGDVRDTQSLDRAVDQAVEARGGLHVLVNCAGVGPAQRTLSDAGPHDLDLFAHVLEVNLTGTFNAVRLAANRMAANSPIGGERGVIVNTSSVAAFEGQVGQAAYAASKGGVQALTLPVARDLARHGIRCVAIAPGTFDTPLLATLDAPVRDRLADAVPHPSRLGAPREFAALVRHVVENPYINGTTLRIDGALRMPMS